MLKNKFAWIFVFFFLVLTINVIAFDSRNASQYFKLDETTDTIVIDSINYLNGTQNGTIIDGVTGILNTAYTNFSTTTFVDTKRIQTDSSFSYNVWINWTNTSFNEMYVIGTDLSAGPDRGWGFYFYDKNISLGCVAVSCGGWTYANGLKLNITGWNMITFTYNAGNNTWNLYTNGLYLGEQIVASGSNLDTTTDVVRIGNRNYGTAEAPYNSAIDEFSYYNYTLTLAQVTELYESFTGKVYFNFTSPTENGVTKYLPNNYLLINVTQNNISNYRNMTIYVYNTTGLYYNITTTSNNTFLNLTLPFINETYYYNVTARNTTNQSINSATYTNYIRYATLNITAFNNTGSALSVFNISINSIPYSTTNGWILSNVILGTTYNIVFDNENKSYSYANTTINSGVNTINATLFPINSLNLSLFDVVTSGYITQPLNIVVTSSSVRNYSTSNGRILLTGLEVGLNEIKVYNVNYSEVRYSLIVVNKTYYADSLYLSTLIASSNLTLTFYNPNGVLVENVLLQQKVLANSSYVLMYSVYSDIVGKVYLTYNPLYSYQYTYSHPDYATTTFILNPPRQSNYDITMSYGTIITPYTQLNVTGNYTYNNNTNMIYFTYTSTNTNLTNYSYTLSKIINSKPTILCYNTSSSLTNTFSCNVTGYTGNIYIQGVVDNRIFYGQYVMLKGTNNLSDVVEQKDASFLMALILLIIIVGGSIFGVVGLGISGVIGVILMYWLNVLTPITLIVVIVDVIVTLIIIFGFRRR